MLSGILPAPKHSYVVHAEDESEEETENISQLAQSLKLIPSYPLRNASNFIPIELEDFRDGGAYPEIHVVQYPLNMGKPGFKSSAVVAVNVDEKGQVVYDALVKQGGNRNKLVQSRLEDLEEKVASKEAIALPDEKEEQETADKTRLALEALLDGKIKSSKPSTVVHAAEVEEPTYIRYTPNPNAPGHSGEAKQRVIRMVEAQVDPMEPPKHKMKKVPRGPPSPPVPVLHSPPRKLTVADQQAWKIPPCVSNWKNARGYTIPLDKRLAADGRGLQEVTINSKFATLSESLHISERKAAEDLRLRNNVRKKLAMQEKEDKEKELREMALKARMERAGVSANDIDERIANGDDEEEVDAFLAQRERDLIDVPAADDFKVDRAARIPGGQRGINNKPAWMTAAAAEEEASEKDRQRVADNEDRRGGRRSPSSSRSRSRSRSNSGDWESDRGGARGRSNRSGSRSDDSGRRQSRGRRRSRSSSRDRRDDRRGSTEDRGRQQDSYGREFDKRGGRSGGNRASDVSRRRRSSSRSPSASPVSSRKEPVVARAASARETAADTERKEREERERIRIERRKERERQLRIENMKGNFRKNKVDRDGERDVSEKIALGMHRGTGQLSGEALFDSRLFNQSVGMDSGFGAEDEYAAYSKPLFDRGEATSVYRPKRDDADTYGDVDAQMAKLRDTSKFKPDKGFKGAQGGNPAGARDAPVQFERARDDPFEIDDIVGTKRSRRDDSEEEE